MIKKLFVITIYSLVVLPSITFLSITKDNFIIKEVLFVLNASVSSLLFLWVVPIERIKGFLKNHGRLLLLAGLYLSSVLLSGINARHFALTVEVFVLHLMFFAVMLLPLALNRNEINNTLKIAACVFAVLCIYGFMQHLGLDPVLWASGFNLRPSSALGNPNFFAGYLVVMLPVLISLSMENKRSRLLWLFIFLIGAVNLFLTWTRGAWIAFAAGMLFFAVVFSSHKKHFKRGVIAVFAIIMLIGFSAASKIYQYFNLSNQSVVERVFKWRTAIEMVKDHSLIGVGAGNLKVNFAVYQKRIKEKAKFKLRGTSESNVHNEFFQILAEQGVSGLASFLLFFGYLYYLFFKSEKTNLTIGLMSGITAFLVMSLTNFPLRIVPTAVSTFLFCGIFLRLNFYGEEKYYIIKPSKFLLFGYVICSLAACGWWFFGRFQAELLRRKGDEHFAGRNYAKAAEDYEKAVKLDYWHSERTAYDLGEAYRSLGRIDDALRAYEISVDLRNYGEVYHNIGNCWYLKNDYEKTLRNWRIARDMELPSGTDQENLEKNIKLLEIKIKENR